MSQLSERVLRILFGMDYHCLLKLCIGYLARDTFVSTHTLIVRDVALKAQGHAKRCDLPRKYLHSWSDLVDH